MARSLRSIYLLHSNACQHTIAVTIGTLEEMHWEVLPHLAYCPDLVPSDFYWFGLIKEALGGRKI
jgi:hypothetical protein